MFVFLRAKGEMAERSNAAVLKTVVPVTEPGVRIPLSPRGGCARRDGRAVECGGLENRCPPAGGPGVRIPLSPRSGCACECASEVWVW